MSDSIRHVMKVPNSTHHLVAVREVVNELVRRSAYPVKKDASAITLAVDEAMANIMEHSLRDHTDGEMEIDMELFADASRVEVILREQGDPFDPGDIEEPNLDTHIKAGRKHGLGLYLIRSIMDEVNYTFVAGGWNEMHMIRFAQRPADG